MLRSTRFFVTNVSRCYAVRAFSAYPSHQVVGMPSLSPTMATGTISKWIAKVGDKVGPGDALAEVETDKAHVTFESQDDFFVAKFLVEEGTEVKVGDPILVTVEDGTSVAAFSGFTLSNAPAAAKPAAPAPAPVAAPSPAAPAPKPAAPQPAPQAAPQPVPAKAPAAAPVAPPKPVAAPATKSTSAISVKWGTGVNKSVLSKKLSADQRQYIEKYGRSAHKGIIFEEKGEKKEKK